MKDIKIKDEHTLIYQDKEYHIIKSENLPVGNNEDVGVSSYIVIDDNGFISEISYRYEFMGFEDVYDEESESYYPYGDPIYDYGEIVQIYLMRITPKGDNQILITHLKN